MAAGASGWSAVGDAVTAAAAGTAKTVLNVIAAANRAVVVTEVGIAQTVQATAAKGYTTEPTVLTAVRRWRVHPQAGQVVQLPLGREVRSNVAKGVCLRVTFESGETTTNIDSYMEFEE
jgi:hypothetical protein